MFPLPPLSKVSLLSPLAKFLFRDTSSHPEWCSRAAEPFVDYLRLDMLLEPPSLVLLNLPHPRFLISGRVIAIMPRKHDGSALPMPRPDGMISLALPAAKPALAQDRFQIANGLHTNPRKNLLRPERRAA
jgi:hypothetical protein